MGNGAGLFLGRNRIWVAVSKNIAARGVTPGGFNEGGKPSIQVAEKKLLES